MGSTVTSVVEFWGERSTGSRFLLKISSRKMFFDLTFTDFQTGREKVPESEVHSKLSISKIIHFFPLQYYLYIIFLFFENFNLPNLWRPIWKTVSQWKSSKKIQTYFCSKFTLNVILRQFLTKVIESQIKKAFFKTYFLTINVLLVESFPQNFTLWVHPKLSLDIGY